MSSCLTAYRFVEDPRRKKPAKRSCLVFTRLTEMPAMPRALSHTLYPSVVYFGCLISLTCGVAARAAEPTQVARARVPAVAPPADRVGIAAVASSWTGERTRQRQRHLVQLGVDRWHAAGYVGRGMKVAVLDTGFRGYRNFLGKVLPENVTVHSFRSDGNLEARDSQHGILCGEVVHTLAPAAQLLFANWDVERPDEFLAAVRWAREQGARIISCSVVTPNWSNGEGGGAVHRDLERLLGSGKAANDLLCFASAGNTTDRHWSGKFHDAGAGVHEWAAGKTENALRPWGKDRVSVELYENPGTDYELAVYNTVTGAEIGRAQTGHNQGDRNSAVVRFDPEEGHAYSVRVQRVRGDGGLFHVATMWASLECTTARASVCFPADGPEVVAMGAVDGDGHRLWYSACGPNAPCPKPDLVAQIPFPTIWRERLFGGTSAAAPQGAALAALCWSRHPDWTADHVRTSLRTAARDLESPGPDYETGYGLIHVPRE